MNSVTFQNQDCFFIIWWVMVACWVVILSFLAEKSKGYIKKLNFIFYFTFFPPLAWKRYMDPSLDTLLTDCKASMNLLYMQVKLKALPNFKS